MLTNRSQPRCAFPQSRARTVSGPPPGSAAEAHKINLLGTGRAADAIVGRAGLARLAGVAPPPASSSGDRPKSETVAAALRLPVGGLTDWETDFCRSLRRQRHYAPGEKQRTVFNRLAGSSAQSPRFRPEPSQPGAASSPQLRRRASLTGRTAGFPGILRTFRAARSRTVPAKACGRRMPAGVTPFFARPGSPIMPITHIIEADPLQLAGTLSPS